MTRISIVEDEVIIAKDIEVCLQNMGYAVASVVNTGEEAVKMANQEHPDLILMDIQLKGRMDGIETAELISSNLDIPIIFLTAYDDEKKLERAKSVMPYGYILKPFQDKNLKIAIEMALYIAKIDAGRKQYEEALENAKLQWEETFDAISDWVAIIDQEFRIVSSNKSSEKYFSLMPQDLVGKFCYEIVHGTSSPISGCPLQKALKSRQREEFEFQSENGRWWHVLMNPIESVKHNEHVVQVVRDITDNKIREKKLIISRKAEAFRILAGGLSHDFNNLLTVIWGNIALLKNINTGEMQQEFIRRAENACELARSLTQKFIALSMSKGSVINKSECDIKKILSTAVQISVKSKDVRISFDYPHVLPSLKVDLEHMLIAFQNIIVNAAEAMPDGGKLNIKAETASIRHPNQKNVNFLSISFEDTGTGISESDLPNVFDPYFTTKEKGVQKGVGLGLADAQAIVMRHGGNIYIDSAIGKGTTVIVSLPVEEFRDAGSWP
jgi:two-component system, cell cycle sensor histidine kinase and response regulator CckA